MKRKLSLYREPSPIPFTEKGFAEKKGEYETLLEKRPHAVSELKKARDMGDLSENGYYKSARWNLSDIDRRLRHLKHLLTYAKIVTGVFKDQVEINTSVTVSDGTKEYTYHVVGDYEADPKQLKISTHSPIGTALLHRKTGEKAFFETQSGKKELTILTVKQTI